MRIFDIWVKYNRITALLLLLSYFHSETFFHSVATTLLRLFRLFRLGAYAAFCASVCLSGGHYGKLMRCQEKMFKINVRLLESPDMP